jgi:hypothetical protein
VARWYIRHGSWWMLQWAWPVPFFSLGIHVEPRRGVTEAGKPFGPYLDLHFWIFVLSIVRNPVYTHGDTYRGTASRGGLQGTGE